MNARTEAFRLLHDLCVIVTEGRTTDNKQPTTANGQLPTANCQLPTAFSSQLRREDFGDRLEQSPVLFRKRCGRVAVNINFTQHAPRAHNGHHNF